jgi:hypothetical protein
LSDDLDMSALPPTPDVSLRCREQPKRATSRRNSQSRSFRGNW